MSYLAGRLNDAVCVELTNILSEKIFADYGTEDDEALGCGLKLHLVLCTLKEQWITEQILEKCIEYVDVLSKSKSSRIKHHVCTTALRIKPEHLGQVKEFLCGLRGQTHYNSFGRGSGEPKYKLEGGKAKLIWPANWEKAVPKKIRKEREFIPIAPEDLGQHVRKQEDEESRS